jgi:hypothetical protein
VEPTNRATDGSYDTLFRVPVTMIDEEGRRWPLTYEGVTCRGQRHFRFTHGWRKFVSCRCIDVGEWPVTCMLSLLVACPPEVDACMHMHCVQASFIRARACLAPICVHVRAYPSSCPQHSIMLHDALAATSNQARPSSHQWLCYITC